MKNLNLKAIVPHLLAVGIFLAASLTYFGPLLNGKKLIQGDIKNFKGMSSEIIKHREETGEEALWTNSMFGGMPAYLISFQTSGNLVKKLDKVFRLWLPRPADYVLLYMIGFYILLCCLKVDPWIAIVGAMAFGFSSYFIIILEAGHNSKAHAIGFIAPLMASMILTYRGKYLLGGAMAALFFTLELACNHVQITYYLGFFMLSYFGFELVKHIKAKSLPDFVKANIVFGSALVIALGCNITSLWSTYEYGKYSTRGKSELTLGAESNSSGLDYGYATQWSYGVSETFTLLVPNFKGGGSRGLEPTKEMLAKMDPQSKQVVPYAQAYYGDQPFTSGPVYVGAIVIFLCVLGFLIIDGSLKWAALTALILTIGLSWGKNFMPLTEFFLDYFPGYNKFRAVSMILIVAELIIPLIAFLALDKLVKEPELLKSRGKDVYTAFAVTGGLCLIMWLMPGLFTDFSNNAGDANLTEQLKGAKLNDIQIANVWGDVHMVRESIFKSDALRSALLICGSLGLLLAFGRGIINKKVVIVGMLVLVVGDLWAVDKRYLNKESFGDAKNMDVPYSPTPADKQILADKDPNFRVFNTTIRLDQDSKTPFFHKSIGGYHGAKMKRFQELIDYQISQNNRGVLDMLNTKYYIIQDRQSGQLSAQRNPNALGNAWFVKQHQLVLNADSELTKLSDINVKTTAVIDQRFKDQFVGTQLSNDPNAVISLTKYLPNELTYMASTSGAAVAIFSEIYYDKGWNAYIDGELVEHFRANYVLRGMIVPDGQHEIVFKFEPNLFSIGENIAFLFSLLLFAIGGYAVYKEFKKNESDADATSA